MIGAGQAKSDTTGTKPGDLTTADPIGTTTT